MGFRPQQGLPIMNLLDQNYASANQLCFRPQQGLPIMNIVTSTVQ